MVFSASTKVWDQDHLAEDAMDAGSRRKGVVCGVPDAAPARVSVIRVVIVDDHSLMRDGAAQLLGTDPDLEVVGLAGTADEGFDLLEQLQPDVALVDVHLPGMNGLEFARRASTLHPAVKLLIVSAYDDYAYVTEALNVGVGGYLLKTASGSELVDAVRAVANGVFVLDRSLSAHLSRRWRSGSVGSTSLSARETDVLRLLARGLTNKYIASELGLGVRTVEGYVSNILAKLGVTSRTGAAAYALAHNLIGGDHHG